MLIHFKYLQLCFCVGADELSLWVWAVWCCIYRGAWTARIQELSVPVCPRRDFVSVPAGFVSLHNAGEAATGGEQGCSCSILSSASGTSTLTQRRDWLRVPKYTLWLLFPCGSWFSAVVSFPLTSQLCTGNFRSSLSLTNPCLEMCLLTNDKGMYIKQLTSVLRIFSRRWNYYSSWYCRCAESVICHANKLLKEK